MNAHIRTLTNAGILTLLASVPTQATELCVKCTGPAASYACIVGGSGNATLDTVAKFYCITALAKAGSHASCSIDRAINPPCPGERKELPIPTFLDGAEGGDRPQEAGAARPSPTVMGTREANAPPSEPRTGTDAPQPDQAGPRPNDQPPKTVQEMVEKSAKSAGASLSQTQKAATSASTALEKAGSAVGGAAKSSWKCLSSFFSNC